MSDSPEMSWSDSPNAPQVPLVVHIIEKEAFAGFLISAISYGTVVALFFQCASVLLNPTRPIKKSVKWALVAHTVAMFSFLTTTIGIYLNDGSLLFINNREFPGDNETFPGPVGYEYYLDTKATTIVFEVMFPLNQWLADGLLLHRCYVIYSMNHWAMAFPCLMYLASVATGIAYIYQGTKVDIDPRFGTSYYTISLSLAVLLTLMIVMKLVVHMRDFRKAIGASHGAGGLYTAIVTILIESYALYAVAFLMYIVPWALESSVTAIFAKFLASVQVIAPYLIILRVANRRAVTSDTITGTIGSIQFGSQETTDGEGTLADGDYMSSMEVDGEAPGGLGVRTEGAVEEVPL